MKHPYTQIIRARMVLNNGKYVYQEYWVYSTILKKRNHNYCRNDLYTFPNFKYKTSTLSSKFTEAWQNSKYSVCMCQLSLHTEFQLLVVFCTDIYLETEHKDLFNMPRN